MAANASLSPGKAISEKEKEALIKKGAENPAWFLRFFLTDWFPEKQPWVHKGIIAILTRKCAWLLDNCDSSELDKIERHFVWKDQNETEHKVFDFSSEVPRMVVSKNTLIMMPRGFSKTTLLNGIMIYWVCYEECEFPVYVSETGTHAGMQMDTVRNELAGNEMIQLVFGNLRPDQRSGKHWSSELAETTNGTTLMAKGRGAQIRGTNFASKRPDRIILDDVEDKESVKTDEQRKKAKEWYKGDVEPALPRMKKQKNAFIVALGTLLHEDAMLQMLRKSPKWNAIVFGAIDKDNEPLWEDMMNKEDLEAEKQDFALAGMLHVFYMEYFNQIRSPETQKFKDHFIIHHPVNLEEVPFRAIAVDPAISEENSADFFAICCVGIHNSGWIQTLDMFMERGILPNEQVDLFFDFALKWGWDIPGVRCLYGIESVAYQAALVHLVRAEMFKRKIYMEVEPIKYSRQDGSKFERVEGILQPRYANGFIKHQRPFPLLETQLLDWPNGKRDGPDVEAMAISLLDDWAPLETYGAESAGEPDYPPLARVFPKGWRRY